MELILVSAQHVKLECLATLQIRMYVVPTCHYSVMQLRPKLKIRVMARMSSNLKGLDHITKNSVKILFNLI